MTSRRIMKRTTALLLSATMIFSLFALLPSQKSVQADWSKDETNTFIGSSVIGSPRKCTSSGETWSGCYVYYAKYNESPLRFRVLDPNCEKYGETSMLLDCDTIPFSASFNSSTSSTSPSYWAQSTICSWINQVMFLTLDKCFTSAESNALMRTEKDSYAYPDSVDGDIRDIKPKSTPLRGNKIFLLDIEDMTNPEYGYYEDYPSAAWSRKKKQNGEYHTWMSRSAYDDSSVFIAKENGAFNSINVKEACGVSPAMNVLKSKIMFTTLLSGTAGKTGSEYKLTVKTPYELKIREGLPISVSASLRIDVPYSYESTADGIYAVITDKEYTESDAQILHYFACTKSQGADDYKGDGVIYFTLPEDLDKTAWGKDYHVYLTAERRYGKYETDSCSNLCEIDRSVLGEKKTLDLRDEGSEYNAADVMAMAYFNMNNYCALHSVGSTAYLDLDKDGTDDIGFDTSVTPNLVRRLPGSNIVGDIVIGDIVIEYRFRFPDCKIPGAISGLTAKAGGKNRVVLNWNAVEGAEGYLIYAQKDKKYGYVGMTTKGTTFTDTKALDSDYNYYWVFPYVKDSRDKMYPGACTKYVFAKGVCSAVTDLKAASVKDGVKLTWTASYQAEGYLVYGIVDGKPYGYVGMTTQGTQYTDKTASKTVYNYYWVYPYHKDANGKMIVGLTGKYTYGRAR